jgi:ESS family glutamate:Na+ symporter
MGEVATLHLGPVEMVGVAAFGYSLGGWIKKRIPILDRLNIPTSIVGGLVYALAVLALRGRWLNVEIDTGVRDLFMMGFFTTVGMSASWRLVRQGGVHVLWMLGLATAGAVVQNVAGMGLFEVFGLNPLLGIISGAAALTGGPVTTLAFGPTFEEMGVAGATTLGLASATFGITAAGLLSGYVGAWFILRRGLKPLPPCGEAGRAEKEAGSSMLANALAVGVAMGAGAIISAGIDRLGIILPAYIGAMIAAAIIRNLDDRFGFVRVSQVRMTEIGVVSLSLFIVMAMLTLKLWELTNLAAPVLVVLLVQVVLGFAMCAVVFRALGRDYESAIMTAGFYGFMLGMTANALASMDKLVRKHGPAPRSYLVVPIVGAFLIDFTNALVITVMMNLWR